MPWRVYRVEDGVLVESMATVTGQAAPGSTLAPPEVPVTWDLEAWELADVTGDGQPEWVLLVWRPWRDWPIQSWLEVASPIADFHDSQGQSCHLILLDPRDGRELWAGSALPAPLLALAVGDVDGDGLAEVITLEGDYVSGRGGLASRIDIWQWLGFGFKLEYRSERGSFSQLYLTDADSSSILTLVVR